MPLVYQTVAVNMVFREPLDALVKFKKELDLFREGRYAAAGEGIKDTLWYKQNKGRAQELVDRLSSGEVATEHKI